MFGRLLRNVTPRWSGILSGTGTVELRTIRTSRGTARIGPPPSSSGPSARRRATWTVLLAIALLTSGCEEGDPTGPGDSLAANGGLVAVLNGVPVGQGWATMNAKLVNTSSGAITLQSVLVSGSGVGTVIEIDGTEIGPIPEDHNSPGFTAGGIYRTYPPTEEFNGECRVQRLVQVKGYVLGSGSEARVLLLMRAIESGPYGFEGVNVIYAQDGRLWSELVDFGQRGVVIDHGPAQPPVSGDERRCADPGQVLPSGRNE